MLAPDLYDQAPASYAVMQKIRLVFLLSQSSFIYISLYSKYFQICNTSLNSEDSLENNMSNFKNCFLKKKKKNP